MLRQKIKEGKEKEGLKEGRAVLKSLKYLVNGLGSPISQWGCCWNEWTGRVLLNPVFPVSVVMQGSGWTFHTASGNSRPSLSGAEERFA